MPVFTDHLEVKPIDRLECEDLLLNVHYAKRWPSVTYRFGLFRNGVLEGCVTYGSPPSSTLRKGIAGDIYKPNVLELNRLVLYSNFKNDASFLIGKSLKLLSLAGNFIVVSFADTSKGHVGKVYQATNFKYYGLSAKRTDWKVKGMEHKHGQTISDEFRGKPERSKLMREKYGDDFYLESRPRKHRYIKVVGTKGFRARVLKKIKYKEAPYPKECDSKNTEA